MNELAVELNSILDSSVVGSFLSPTGRRLYFPKGIVAQSAEAAGKARRFNATIGLATSEGQPMHLQDIYSRFAPGTFEPKEIFSYAPGGGDRTLRSIWKQEMIRKNPTLQGKSFSSPLVTAGLTHGISMIATLFVGDGDEVVCPDLYWDNYELIFSELAGGRLRLFHFFTEDGHFNVDAMKEALLAIPGPTARIILNFPNNPTGYTPSRDEARAIVAALREVAAVKKVMVISDDAYFGLFYEDETEKESLFSYLCDADENIFALKIDGATKEEMVWGFRIGFISFGFRGVTPEVLDALEKKVLGAIRCTVSNCDRPGQSMLLDAIRNGKHYDEDKKRAHDMMRRRYEIIRKALEPYMDHRLLRPYPFNSGYFMAFDTCGHDAEELRTYLLDRYEIGAINIKGRSLRLAYCSVEEDRIVDLISLLYRAVEELWG